jgi:NADH:flavin oxidoreductases, Old Yellow Enzyme family
LEKVTDAVHAAGGHMAMQLWHVGRISHHLLQQDGQAPVAPSALRSDTGESFVVLPDEGPKRVPCDMPRALETAEIPGIIADYRRAAERALQAGFDLLDCTAPTAIYCNSFWRPTPTSAPINTAAAWKTAPASCSKPSMH